MPLLNDREMTETETIPFITEIRQSFLQIIQNQIQSYFPMNDLSLFKVFQPSNIPSQVSQSLSYGVSEIINLCRVLKLGDCDKLLEEWAKLIESIIIESDNFSNFRNRETKTFVFWSHFLAQNYHFYK